MNEGRGKVIGFSDERARRRGTLRISTPKLAGILNSMEAGKSTRLTEVMVRWSDQNHGAKVRWLCVE